MNQNIKTDVFDFEISWNGIVKQCGNTMKIPSRQKSIGLDHNTTYLIIIDGDHLQVSFKHHNTIPLCAYDSPFFMKTFNRGSNRTFMKTYAAVNNKYGYLVGLPTQYACSGYDLHENPRMYVTFSPEIIKIAIIETSLIDKINDPLVMKLFKNSPQNPNSYRQRREQAKKRASVAAAVADALAAADDAAAAATANKTILSSQWMLLTMTLVMINNYAMNFIFNM